MATVTLSRSAIEALHRSYRRIEAEAVGAGAEVKAETAADWIRNGGAEGIAGRVAGVSERGRSQAGGRPAG